MHASDADRWQFLRYTVPAHIIAKELGEARARAVVHAPPSSLTILCAAPVRYILGTDTNYSPFTEHDKDSKRLSSTKSAAKNILKID
jgi:hypothetical protein